MIENRAHQVATRVAQRFDVGGSFGRVHHTAAREPDALGQMLREQDRFLFARGRQFNKDDEVIDLLPMLESVLPLLAAFEAPDPTRQRNVHERL